MITNVFTPQVGGITRSVQQFTEEYRKCGHQVLVVAPEYEHMPADEAGVVRVRSIPRAYQNLYPLPLPNFSTLAATIDDFQPDVVHSHHPFLLGSTAQALAARYGIPLVYTHHTRYSVYIENKTNWPRALEDSFIEMVINYCNLCDAVIAPSEKIRELLIEGGVTSDIAVVPTGVQVDRFRDGNGSEVRSECGIPGNAFVVGHVGRLAPEKNCEFLARVLAGFLGENADAHVIIAGEGSKIEEMKSIFAEASVVSRVHWYPVVSGKKVSDIYHAMDVFAFASHTETQGMVLTEAMAAGVPVVAVEATGVCDLIHHGENGWMIAKDDLREFQGCLAQVKSLGTEQRNELHRQMQATVERFSLEKCAAAEINVYRQAIREHELQRNPSQQAEWGQLLRTWEAAWQRWLTRSKFAASAIQHLVSNEEHPPKI